MMNHVEHITKSTDYHLLFSFFKLHKITETTEKVILELAFLPTALVWQSRPVSLLGLIVDQAASLVGQPALGDCLPVELEVFVHVDSLPEQLKVIASIELVGHGHGLFNCQVYASLQHAPELLAAAHGTLKQC